MLHSSARPPGSVLGGASRGLQPDAPPGRTRVDDVAFAVTDDGWRLAMHHFRPSGRAQRRHAVILCHGLGANHIAFDLDVEISLARHLAHLGYAVFALDLRGHGMSDRPTFFGVKRYGWSFDDYLLRDVPAAIAHAARLSNRSQVHWIGHSMGGLLLYAHLARGRSEDIRSGITVGSSLDYSRSRSGFKAVAPLRAVLDYLPAVPMGLVAWLCGAVAGRVRTPFETFNIWSSNVDPRLWARLCQSAFHTVSAPVLMQLATAMDPGGLLSLDGSMRYAQELAQIRAPMLSLAGDMDRQCPPDAARETLDALGSTRRELRVFGPDHGHADHYGHFDLLMGRRVKEEVFPCIATWLEDHD